MASIGITQANDYGFEGRSAFTVATVNGVDKYVIDLDAVLPIPPSSYNLITDDFTYHFLLGMNQAQKGVNSNLNRSFNAFRDPIYSPPVLASNGLWYSTVTFTVALKVRVDKPDSAVEA